MTHPLRLLATTAALTLAAHATLTDVFVPGSHRASPSAVVALAGTAGEHVAPSWLYATAAGELRVSRSRPFPGDFMAEGVLLDADIGPIDETTLNGALKLSLETRPGTGLRAAAWRRVRHAGTLIQTGELIVAREQTDGTWDIEVVDSVIEGSSPSGKMIAQSTDIVFHPEDRTMQVLYQRRGDLYCAFEESPGGSFSAIPFHQGDGHSGNSIDAVWYGTNRLFAYHQDALLGDIVRTVWESEALGHELLGPSPPTQVRAARHPGGVAAIYEVEQADGDRFIELLLDGYDGWTRHVGSFVGPYGFQVHDLLHIERTGELVLLFDGPHIGINAVFPPSHPVMVSRDPDGSTQRVELSHGPEMRRPVAVSDIAEATVTFGYHDDGGSLRTLVDGHFAPRARGGLPLALELFLGLGEGEQPGPEHFQVSNPSGELALFTLRRTNLFDPVDPQTFKLIPSMRQDLHVMFEFSYHLDQWFARGLDIAAEVAGAGVVTTTYVIDGEPAYADANPPAAFARVRLSRAPTPD